MKRLSLIPYMGGKNRLAPWIISHFPPHRTCVEVFGGSAGVMFRKPKSTAEVYNDKWSDVVHLFLMLRDRGKELKEFLRYTPVSHSLFDEYNEKLLKTRDFRDDIERAGIVFTVLNICYAGILGRVWEVKREKSLAPPIKNKVNHLEMFIDRLRGVSIENMDFDKVIRKWDADNVVFYCDPPYLLENGKPNEYYCGGFTNRDHRRLAETLSNIRGKAMISYYPNDLVFELYPKDEWTYRELEVIKHSQTVKRGESKPKAIELLIMNFEPPKRSIWGGWTDKKLMEAFE